MQAAVAAGALTPLPIERFPPERTAEAASGVIVVLAGVVGALTDGWRPCPGRADRHADGLAHARLRPPQT
jgi:hypothetical protein